jgi:hypothetical protein
VSSTAAAIDKRVEAFVIVLNSSADQAIEAVLHTFDYKTQEKKEEYHEVFV